MKVAILSNASGRAHETYTVIMRSLAGEMAASGDQAVFIGLRKQPSDPYRSEIAGLPAYYVGRRGSWLHMPFAAAQMAAIFRQERVDVVHFHLAGPDYLGFWLVALFRKLPFVLTFHSFSVKRLRDCGAVYPAILRFLLRRATGVTAVSRAVSDPLKAFDPALEGKIRIVGNGVDRVPAASPPDRDPARTPYILYAGPLCHEKGTDLLLLAFSDLVARTRRPLRLVLCGEDLTGGLFSNLAVRLGIASRVDSLGPCAHERVLELMRDCFFYVCPSREETFGIAILEAMASGKAVIAPRIGGVPDYIQDNVQGRLFQPGSVTELAEAMTRLVEDQESRRRLETQAPSAAARYSWSGARQGYRDAYLAAIAA